MRLFRSLVGAGGGRAGRRTVRSALAPSPGSYFFLLIFLLRGGEGDVRDPPTLGAGGLLLVSVNNADELNKKGLSRG